MEGMEALALLIVKRACDGLILAASPCFPS